MSIDLKNDRLIIKLDNNFYSAEIFEDNRSFTYESMRCGDCNNNVFTDFNAELISDNVAEKVNYEPDITLDYKIRKKELKIIVCDKCTSIDIKEDIVSVLGESDISHVYSINNKKIELPNKFYNEIKLYFWQTQKEPIDIIMDTSYHDLVRKYLDENMQKIFFSKYNEIVGIARSL